MAMPAGLHMPYGPRYLAAAPISHQAYPFIAPTLLSGGTVFTIPRFDPELFARTVAEQRITFTTGVPTMIYSLLDYAQTNAVDLSSIEGYLYGAGPMSIDRLGEAHERFGQVFSQGYGIVEALGLCTALPPSMHSIDDPARLASAGIPYACTQLSILDPDGHELADGQLGEICVRSPGVMREYWNQPEETELAFRHGWMHTGDVGVRDERGFYTIVDRIKDIVISGGYNVFAAEIEQIIARDRAVSSVAVIGVPDPKWGEAVKALVIAAPGQTVDSERIKALVRTSKGPVHTPKTVEIVDAFPLTAAGKINKRKLREEFSGPQAHHAMATLPPVREFG
jgi:fatty-acyl-CoA synthase